MSPKCKCSKVCAFFGLFCVVYFLESIGGTYMITAVQSIEKQFSIPSRMSGGLISAHDFGYIPTVVILSYLGSKGNRARWIGAGCILIAVSNCFISLPNFIFPQKPPVWNETAVDITIGREMTYERMLNFAALKKRMPEGIRETLLQKLSGDGEEEEEGGILDFFGIDFDEDEDDNTSSLVRSKRETKVDPQMMENFMAVMAGEMDVKDFLDLIKGKVIPKIKPHMMRGASSPLGFCSPIINGLKELIEQTKCLETSTNGAAVAIIFCALIFVGVAHTMPWSLGVPLIDDNVKKRSLPVYFAFMFFIKIMGPIAGFFIGAGANRLYFTLEQPRGLTPMDPRWIGAWWIGFLVIAIVLFGPSLALFFFPHDVTTDLEKDTEERATMNNRAPQSKRKRQLNLVDKHKKQKEIDDPNREKGFTAELKRFWQALVQVLKSPVYTGALIGRVFDAFAFKGFYVFLPKYLDNHYGIPQYKASLFMGSFGIVGFATGMLSGSFLMRKLNLEGRKAAAWVGMCSLLSAIISFSKIGLGCHSVVNSIGQIGLQNNFNFTQSCNSDCFCEPVNLMPVCSQSGKVFYSPCHAGCRNMTVIDRTSFDIDFSDCTCVPDGELDKVSRDWCEDDCTTMIILYFTLATIGGFVGGLGVIPAILIVLRSVPPEHRSISIGFSGFVVSIGTLTAPIFFGVIIDSTCLLWEKTCTGTGSCSIYEPTQLRTRMHLLYGILRAIALIFDVWVWYFAKNLKLMAESPESATDHENGAISNEEMIALPKIEEFGEDDLIHKTSI